MTPLSARTCRATSTFKPPLARAEALLFEGEVEPTGFVLLLSLRLSIADSMTRVFTTSSGVVINDATEPAALALIAVTAANSEIDPVALPFCFLLELVVLFKCSYMGNCIAVNGRFRAAREVYPLSN